MNILQQTHHLVKTRIFSVVRRKHRLLFQFGIQALTLTPFCSLNSNARKVVANENTAHSKIYRLLSNKRLLHNFFMLVRSSGMVTPHSLVNVDFSSFCRFETLAFAVQSNLGRAIPVWVSCLTYPIKEVTSQNLFILRQMKQFGKTLGFWPRFVFDRGFILPCLIAFMLKRKITFYLRVKAGQGFVWEDKRHQLEKHSAMLIGRYSKDTSITAYGVQLRLIVSPPPPKKEGETKRERWYIITNDFTSSRKEILRIYRCRFEIEETFKDIKHICNLKKLFIKKKLSFTILLWFVSLSFWLAWWSREKMRVIHEHIKKRRLWFCRWWEELQRSLREQRLGFIVAKRIPP